MGILSHEERKKIDEHFMLACIRGAYQNLLLKKSDGGAYRGGALKGMNKVLHSHVMRKTISHMSSVLRKPVYAPNFEKVDGAYCFWSVR